MRVFAACTLVALATAGCGSGDAGGTGVVEVSGFTPAKVVGVTPKRPVVISAHGTVVRVGWLADTCTKDLPKRVSATYSPKVVRIEIVPETCSNSDSIAIPHGLRITLAEVVGSRTVRVRTTA